MEHHQSKLWGIVPALAGGMSKYFLQANIKFPQKLMEAIITAFICGMVGAAGKWLFDYVAKKIKRK